MNFRGPLTNSQAVSRSPQNQSRRDLRLIAVVTLAVVSSVVLALWLYAGEVKRVSKTSPSASSKFQASLPGGGQVNPAHAMAAAQAQKRAQEVAKKRAGSLEEATKAWRNEKPRLEQLAAGELTAALAKRDEVAPDYGDIVAFGLKNYKPFALEHADAIRRWKELGRNNPALLSAKRKLDDLEFHVNSARLLGDETPITANTNVAAAAAQWLATPETMDNMRRRVAEDDKKLLGDATTTEQIAALEAPDQLSAYIQSQEALYQAASQQIMDGLPLDPEVRALLPELYYKTAMNNLSQQYEQKLGGDASRLSQWFHGTQWEVQALLGDQKDTPEGRAILTEMEDLLIRLSANNRQKTVKSVNHE